MRLQHHPTAESPNVELRKWLQERTDAVECRSKSGVGRTALQRELAAGGAGARAGCRAAGRHAQQARRVLGRARDARHVRADGARALACASRGGETYEAKGPGSKGGTNRQR